MNLGKNLRYLRLQHGLSQDYVAAYLGYKSYTTIQKWETGVSEPPLESLSKLATLYKVDMDTLYLVDLEAGNLERPKRYTEIPLLGTVTAGVPILAQESIECYIIIDNTIRADFALKIKGDSMVDARINDGDIVFIRKQPTVENGEIAAVIIKDEATLKRVYKNNEGVILKPENSNYQPRYYTAVDFKKIRVLGKAIFFQSKL